MVIPFDAGAGTTDRTDDLFVETNRFAVLRSDNHFAVPAGQHGFEQLVALFDRDGVHAVLPWTRIGFEQRFFSRYRLWYMMI